MTKDKHEALRKDMEDYRLLLIQYKAIRLEQDILIADLERQGIALEKQIKISNEFRKKNDELVRQIEILHARIEHLVSENSELKKEYGKLKRGYFNEKSKVIRMTKAQADLNLWRSAAVFFFIAMLIVGSQA